MTRDGKVDLFRLQSDRTLRGVEDAGHRRRAFAVYTERRQGAEGVAGRQLHLLSPASLWEWPFSLWRQAAVVSRGEDLRRLTRGSGYSVGANSVYYRPASETPSLSIDVISDRQTDIMRVCLGLLRAYNLAVSPTKDTSCRPSRRDASDLNTSSASVNPRGANFTSHLCGLSRLKRSAPQWLLQAPSTQSRTHRHQRRCVRPEQHVPSSCAICLSRHGAPCDTLHLSLSSQKINAGRRIKSEKVLLLDLSRPTRHCCSARTPFP